MAVVSQIRDEYLIDILVQSNIEEAAEKAAEGLSKIDVESQKAATSVKALSGVSAENEQAIRKLDAALEHAGLSASQSSFIMRQFSLAGIDTFTALNAGEPIVDVLTGSISQLGYELTLSRHGFHLVTEGIQEVAAAMGGWAITAAVASVATLAVGLTVLGYQAESAAREEKLLGAQLSLTRTDYEEMAAGLEKSNKLITSTTKTSREEATAMFTAFAGVPSVAIPQIEGLERTAIGLAKAMGVDLKEATKVVVDALKDPLKAATDAAKAGMTSMDSVTLGTIVHLNQMGDRIGATRLTLNAFGEQARSASEQQTPLQEALKKLGEAFNQTGESGESFASQLGKAVTGAATDAVKALTAVLNGLRNAIDYLDEVRKKSADLPSVDEFGRTAPTGGLNLQRPNLSFGRQPTDGSFPFQQAPIASQAIDVNKFSIAAEETAKSFTDAMKSFVDKYVTLESSFQQINPKTGGTLTSSAGAMGLFQLMPGTAQGLGVNANDANQNISGGLTLIQHLWEKYQGDEAKVALGMAWGETKADQFFAGVKKLTDIPAATADEVKKLSGRDVASLAPLYGPTSPSSDALASATDQRRLAQAGALDIGAIRENEKALAAVTEQIKQQTAARKEANDANRPDLVAEYDKNLAKLAYDQKILTDRSYEYAQQQKNEAETTRLVGAADQELLKVKQGIQEQADRGAPLSEAEANERIAATQERLAAGYTNLKAKQDIQIAASDAVAVAWEHGGRAAAELQAHQDAVTTAANFFSTKSEEYKRAVDELTERNLNLASGLEKVKAAQEGSDLGNQADLLRTEIATLGQDADARATLISHIQNEISVRQQYQTLSEAGIEKLVAERDAVNELTRSLQAQQDNLNFLSSEFTSAFNTIGGAMAQAFVQGQAQAVNWGNVMKSVVQQVIQKFAELAVLNPIINELFGGQGGRTLPTLTSVLGALGGGGGIAAGAAGSGVWGDQWDLPGGGLGGGGGGGGGIGTLGTGLSIFGGLRNLYNVASNGFSGIGAFMNSAPQSALSSLFGTGTGLFEGGGSIANFLATPVANLFGTAGVGALGAGGAATTSALSGMGALYGPETAAQFTAAGGAIPTTLGGALTGVGAGFAAGSLIGGLVQHATGKTGPGPEIGAGIGSAALVAGAALAPETFGLSLLAAGLIGGAAGGAAGGLIGPKPASPFSSTYVGVNQSGQLDLGRSISQMVETTADRAAAQAAIDQTNAVLSAAGIQISGIAGASGPGRRLGVQPGDIASIQIGQNTIGGETDPSKFASLSDAFSQLRFSSSDPHLNAFLSANGGAGFADTTQLSNVVGAVKSFIAATSGTEFASHIDTTLQNAEALGGAGTAISDYLAGIQTFVTQTVPGLQALGNNTGSYADAVKKVNDQFNPAIAQAHALGYAEESLTQTRDKITAKLLQDERDAAEVQRQGLVGRELTALGTVSKDPNQVLNASLYNFDQSATAQRKALVDQYTSILGDNYAASYEYQMNSQQLDKTLYAERLSIQQQFDDQMTANWQAATRTWQGLAARQFNAEVTLGQRDPQSAALYSFDIGAQQQREDLSKSLTTMFGPAYAASQNYADQMAQLERTLGLERLVIIKQINDQITQNYQTMARGWEALYSRQLAAQVTLGTMDPMSSALYSFDTGAQAQREDLAKSLTDMFGPAYAASAGYAQEMAQLETTLGQERLATIKQINDQITANYVQRDRDWQALYARQLNAMVTLGQLDPRTAAAYSFDTGAAQQRQDLSKHLTDTFGVAYRATAAYAQEMAQLEVTLGKERLVAMQQVTDQAKQTAGSTVTSLTQYIHSLQFGAASPLNPQAQLDLARSQFNAVSGAAIAGDYNSIAQLQSYSQTLVETARQFYGGGQGYIDAVSTVANVADKIGSMSDAQLTNAVFTAEARSQTAQLVDELQQLRAEVAALRTQVAAGATMPGRLAA